MTVRLTYWNGNKRTILARCFEWTRSTGYFEFKCLRGNIRYSTDHVRSIEVL